MAYRIRSAAINVAITNLTSPMPSADPNVVTNIQQTVEALRSERQRLVDRSVDGPNHPAY